MTNTEKATAIMKSNLDDDLKVELIALIMNPTPVQVVPMYTEDGWLKRTYEDGNWWEKLRCQPNTGDPIEDWNPAREMYERAQADSVANHRIFYKSDTSCVGI